MVRAKGSGKVKTRRQGEGCGRGREGKKGRVTRVSVREMEMLSERERVGWGRGQDTHPNSFAIEQPARSAIAVCVLVDLAAGVALAVYGEVKVPRRVCRVKAEKFWKLNELQKKP